MDPSEPKQNAPELAGEAPDASPSRAVLAMVFQQAWGLSVAYLALGLGAELARRAGAVWAGPVQEFLDGLPFFAIRVTGMLDLYLRASAIGDLSPFWNRMLLSTITVAVILVQALLLGALLAGGWTLALRRKKRR